MGTPNRHHQPLRLVGTPETHRQGTMGSMVRIHPLKMNALFSVFFASLLSVDGGCVCAFYLV